MKNSLYKTGIHIGGRKKVNPAEIILLQADTMYTHIFLHDGKKLMVATTLKTLKNRFRSHRFFRTHKSFLVNPAFVAVVEHSSLRMTDDSEVMISRRKRTAFLREITLN